MQRSAAQQTVADSLPTTGADRQTLVTAEALPSLTRLADYGRPTCLQVQSGSALQGLGRGHHRCHLCPGGQSPWLLPPPGLRGRWLPAEWGAPVWRAQDSLCSWGSAALQRWCPWTSRHRGTLLHLGGGSQCRDSVPLHAPHWRALWETPGPWVSAVGIPSQGAVLANTQMHKCRQPQLPARPRTCSCTRGAGEQAGSCGCI